MATRSLLRLGELRKSSRQPEIPRGKRHNRHTSELHGALQQRQRQSEATRRIGDEESRLQVVIPSMRANIHEKSRHRRSQRTGVVRLERAQDLHRHPLAGVVQGARGAVRARPNRLLSHALQTQPDAKRTLLCALSPLDDAHQRWPHDPLGAMDGAHFGRLGQPSHLALRGLPLRRLVSQRLA